MALRNYKPKTDIIHTGEEETTVRGLNITDVSILADAHWLRMKAVYDFYASEPNNLTIDEKVNRTILECLRISPDLAGGIIALACGEPDEVEAAKSLPFTTQVDALVKIMTLTLEESGGLGNFSAVLRQVAGAVKAAVSMNAPQHSNGPATPSAPSGPPPGTPLTIPDPLATH